MVQGDAVMNFLLYLYQQYNLQIFGRKNLQYWSTNSIYACLILELCETFHLHRFLDPSLSPNAS